MSKKLIILGSGPAGWTAAIYAARAGLNPTLITGLEKGGQLMTTTDVDNWPADVNGVLGSELMERFEQHALRFGTKIIYDHIHQVHLKDKPFQLIGDNGHYQADALIIATGASAKYLGLPSEQAFLGKGVSGCATCDGFFYRNQEVAVVGGGNTAIEEALYLSNIANVVHLVHRRETFRAEQIMIDQVMNKVQEGKIVLHLNKEVKEIIGDTTGVNGAELIDTQNKSISQLNVTGVFIAIGHKPNTDLFKGQLDMDEVGYLKVNRNALQQTQTTIEGVFAAGDVADNIYRQAITSAASGCQAALDVAHFLRN